MKNFDEILGKTFGCGVPIFTSQIVGLCPEISRVAVFNNINRSIERGFLKRHTYGVYYIPGAQEQALSPEAIIAHKYIEDGNTVFGYYSGQTLAYQAGIVDEKPSTLELTSNKASNRLRRLGPMGDWEEVVIRKPRCKVTSYNVDVLQFMDLITLFEPCQLDEEKFSNLAKVAQFVGRTKAIRYVEVFPAKTAKHLMEGELLGIFR